jgi:hypothetical protein
MSDPVYVYNFDHASGVFVGASDARPDPMQPGQYLLPAFATWDAPPPFDRATQFARFVAGAWRVEAIPQPAPEAAAPAPASPEARSPVDSYPVTPASREDMLRQAQAQLLAASDWVVIRAMERGEAVPADWAAYRQTVRDVDKQDSWPSDVKWPVAPGVAA